MIRAMKHADRSQPDGRRDMDMLEVRLGSITYQEYRIRLASRAASNTNLPIGTNARELLASSLTVLIDFVILVLLRGSLDRSMIYWMQSPDAPEANSSFAGVKPV